MNNDFSNLAFLGLVPFGDTADGNPPDSFLLLKLGRNDFTKGGTRSSFQMTSADAAKILDDFRVRGKDLVVDYDHQSVIEGVQAPAAGWISSLELTDAGIVAGGVSWTEEGRRRLSAREYRYHSPVILFGADGHPVKLHSVALTNHPALHNYAPLVADDNQKENNKMNEHLKKLAEALGLPTTFDDGKDADSEERMEALKSASAGG